MKDQLDIFAQKVELIHLESVTGSGYETQVAEQRLKKMKNTQYITGILA